MNDADWRRSSDLTARFQTNRDQLGIGRIVLDEQCDQRRSARVDYSDPGKTGIRNQKPTTECAQIRPPWRSTIILHSVSPILFRRLCLNRQISGALVTAVSGKQEGS
jgi:hypothetical protein